MFAHNLTNMNDTSENTATHKFYLLSKLTESEVFAMIIATLWMILFMFGTVGNGLIIYIAIKYKKLNDITNCYIFNLAITDILFSLLCIPFTTILYLSDEWIFGDILCKLYHFFSRTSVQITCLTLMVMTIHRCNVIIKNKTSSKSENQRIIVIVSTLFIWFVSCLISIPDLLYYKKVEERVNNTVATHCQLTGAFYWYKFTNLIAVFTAYTLPLLIIILSYARLLSFLSSNQRRFAKFTSNNDSGSLLNKSINTTNSSKAKNKKKRVTKMVAVITFNFGMCWLLTHILVILRQFDLHKSPIGSDVFYLLKIFAHTLTYLTPVINPCLYGFYNENFRVPLSQMYTSIRNFCRRTRQE